MSSYLAGRTQFVVSQQVDEKTSNIKTYISPCKEIKYGVPQGCLGTPFVLVVYKLFALICSRS
jgi:hypothetical protein